MPVILLTNSYSDAPLNIVKNQLPPGFELVTLSKLDRNELMNKAVDADYFLASGRLVIDEGVIDAAKQLKMIQRTGVGLDTLDLNCLKERGIPVYINHGVNAISVAEHTLLLILSVLRRLVSTDASVRAGKWLKNELGLRNCELNNKKVGLIGLGEIGINVAKMLQPFGVSVLYYKRSRLTENEEASLKVSYRNMVDLLKEIDVLSLHCPFNKDTEGLIGFDEIALMKKGSFIINTARGRLIVEDALIKNLHSGHLGGAGLDVYKDEPLPKDSPLFKLDNVVLTPHVGGLTMETFTRMIGQALENIRLFDDGKAYMLEDNKLTY